MIYHLMFFTAEHTELMFLRKAVGVSMIAFTVLTVLINLTVIVVPAV